MPKAKGVDPIAEELGAAIEKQNAFAAKMEGEIAGMRSVLETQEQLNEGLNKRFEEVTENLTRTEAELRKVSEDAFAAAKSEMMALFETARSERTALQEELHSLRDVNLAKLQANVEESDVKMNEALESMRQMIADAKGHAGSTADVLRESLQEEARRQAESEAVALARLQALVDANADVMRKEDQALRTSVDELNSDLASKHATTEKALMDLAAAFEEQLIRMREDMRQELKGQLFKQVKDEIDEGFRHITERTAQQIRYIERTVEHHALVVNKTQWTVENMYTRAVTWKVTGFRKKAFALTRSEDCFLVSPGFSVCSLPDMALELHVKSSDEPTAPLPGAVVVPVPGMCSLKVWGPRGMHAIFRLSVGEGSSCISRRYDCTFPLDGVTDSAGRTCFVAHNICQQNAAYDRATDSAVFGLELLEFRMLGTTCISNEPRYVPLHVLSLDEEQLEAGPEDKFREAAAASRGEKPVESDGDGESAPLGSETTEDREARAEQERLAAAEAEAAEKLAAEQAEIDEQLEDIIVGDPDGTGTVGASRFATSELILQERMQREHQALKNKAVRRIEWKLEGLARILELCSVGQAIDSPLFNAAGVQGLQLHFYPRGNEATSNGAPGAWCALFVSGPARTTLRGTLTVGVASKPIEHRFARKGDAGGRAKFCNLEAALNCDDCILLALEITHLDVELPDVATTLCIRESRAAASLAVGGSHAGQPPGSGGERPERSSHAASQVTGARGLLRMKREDPSKTEELMRCVSLPQLNTREKQRPLARLLPKN